MFSFQAQMEKMSPDELKRRQEYLKEQREKLLKMKQQDREKQLTTALKSNPARPQSARAARAALANEGINGTSFDLFNSSCLECIRTNWTCD